MRCHFSALLGLNGLRDYQTGEWEGGDSECSHIKSTYAGTRDGLSKLPGAGNRRDKDGSTVFMGYKSECAKCGAKRIDQQLGSEPSPDCNTQGQAQCGRCFVCAMVKVFRAVRRVLRQDGILMINLGDSYNGSGGSGGVGKQDTNRVGKPDNRAGSPTLKGGNLVGIPWRVALALQADGWILRSDIPWTKRSPMPESVKNRPAKALEYCFLFCKKMGYYWDGEAVKRAAHPESYKRYEAGFTTILGKTGDPNNDAAYACKATLQKDGQERFRDLNGRNFWQADLWFESVDTPHGLTRLDDEIVGLDVTSQGYDGAHFATFPERLVEPFILAGTSAKGCCADCGAPWKRLVERQAVTRERPNEYVKRTGAEGTGNSCANTVAGVEARTVGWEPTCECHGKFVKRREKVVGQAICDETNIPNGWDVGLHSHDTQRYATAEVAVEDKAEQRGRAKAMADKERWVTVWDYVSDLPLEEHPVRPCICLDPFIGSGTVASWCVKNGRWVWGIDLSRDYLKYNAIPRVEGVLLGRPRLAGLIPPKRKIARKGPPLPQPRSLLNKG